MFKPLPLVVVLLASGSSIFPLMPFVAATSAAVEDKHGEEAYSHLRTLSSGVSRKLQNGCNANHAVTTQDAGDPYSLGCMQDYPSSAGKYGCTANDVRVAGVNVTELRDAESMDVIQPNADGEYECSEGALLDVDFTAEVLNGAKSTRFDAAVFWSDDDTAKSGNNCAYTSFTAFLEPGPTDGLPNLEDLTAVDPSEDDDCGDMPGQTTDFADICGLKIVCQDLSANGDAKVSVASCTTYKVPGANKFCVNNDPESFLPGSPSKCKCEFTEFPINIKTAAPSSSPSSEPSASPTESPSESPSAMPSESPSDSPSGSPSCPPAKFTACTTFDSVPCTGGTIPEAAQPPVTDSCDTEVSFECCTGVDAAGNAFINRTWTVKNTEESEGGQEPDICEQLIPITCSP